MLLSRDEQGEMRPVKLVCCSLVMKTSLLLEDNFIQRGPHSSLFTARMVVKIVCMKITV